MGLLNRVTQEILSKNPVSCDSKTLKLFSFQQWAESKGFAHCGIFMSSSRVMTIRQAYNIDAETILASASSIDFWNNSIRDSGWILYDKENPLINNFLNFFSAKTKETIENLAFLKIEYDNQPLIFFAYSEKQMKLPELTSDFLPVLFEAIESSEKEKDMVSKEDFAELSGNLEPTLSVLSLKYSIDMELNGTSHPESLDACFELTIYDEIHYTLKKLFSYPNCAFKGSDSEIKMLFFTTKLMDMKLVKEEISDSLKTILSDQALSKIILISKTKAVSYKDAEDFLIGQ